MCLLYPSTTGRIRHESFFLDIVWMQNFSFPRTPVSAFTSSNYNRYVLSVYTNLYMRVWTEENREILIQIYLGLRRFWFSHSRFYVVWQNKLYGKIKIKFKSFYSTFVYHKYWSRNITRNVLKAQNRFTVQSIRIKYIKSRRSTAIFVHDVNK